MKTLEEIINQTPVYLNSWNHKYDVVVDFEGVYMSKRDYESTTPPYLEEYWLENKAKMAQVLEKYEDINILFASYGEDNYSGDAYVLFEQDGQLYEAEGSHCSCYGLEGQWSPEEVLFAELENRLLNGTFGEDDWAGNSFKEELCEFLDVEYRLNR